MTIPNRDAQLELAMAEYLALLEGGQQPDRAAFLSARKELAPELEPILIRIEKLQGASRQVTSDPVQPRQLPMIGKHTRIGEFEIVQFLGRGGMGVVYEAIQTPLHRRVALKVLPVDAAIDAAARARFLREARMAALLHHPNIVPVHAVGEVNGVQFYAMQFIDGQPLDVVIRVLRQRAGVPGVSQDSSSSADGGLLATGLTVGFGPGVASPISEAQPHQSRTYLSEVVRVIAEAATALEYAHEHHIIHRDIKPGNLLLDVRGHVWLNDFGLAKLLINDGTKTTTGRVGTVRYMSPEMVEGRKNEIDERTDVYGLGLALYELLTLRPAYSAQTESELLRKILNDEPTSIRKYNPAVAIDLETIVHKAIAKVPSDRYASSQAFADDLTRYRNGLPVLARQLTRWQRTQRWAKRRRRVLIGAGLAVTIGVILGLTVSMYFIVSALRQTQHQRDRTALREQELLTLVEQVNQSEFLLQNIPNAQFEQRKLVLQAKSTLCALADDPAADRTVRWAAFRACIRLAEIESRHRRQDDAAIAASEAHSRITKLLQNGPLTRKERIELARANSFLAGTFAAFENRQAAIEYYHIALEMLESLDAEIPNDTPVLNQLGQLRELLAELLVDEGKVPEAIALSRRGLELNELLAKQFPRGHPQSYIRLVLSHSRLARFEQRLGNLADVEGHLREAVKNHHIAVREAGDKANPIYTFEATGRLGSFYLGRNRLQDARASLLECINTAEEYQKKFPSEQNYPNELVWCYLEMGRIEYLEGHTNEARMRFLQTVQLAMPRQNRIGVVLSVESLSRIPMTDLVDWSTVQSISVAQLQRTSDFSNFRLTLALSQLAQGDLKSAEAGLQYVLNSTSAPKQVAGLAEYTLASCQAKRGDLTTAQATFASAEKHNWHQFATDGSIRVARKVAEEAIQKASR